jgi:hypothetical protein
VDIQFWITVQGPLSSGDEPLPNLSNQIGLGRKQPGEGCHESSDLRHPVHRASGWISLLRYPRFSDAGSAEVLKSLDLRNLLARRMYREIGNGRGSEHRGLDMLLGFTGDKGGLLVVSTYRVSSFFSSTISRVESLEGFGSVALAFTAPSELSGSEYRNLSIWSTSLLI